jgi:hypothetical protein
MPRRDLRRDDRVNPIFATMLAPPAPIIRTRSVDRPESGGLECLSRVKLRPLLPSAEGPLSRPEPTSISGTARGCAEFGCPGPRVSRREPIATSSASCLVRQHLWLSIGVTHKQEWFSGPAHSVSIASQSPKPRLRAGCGAVLCDSAAPKSCPAGVPKVSRQPCCETHGIHIAE